MSHLVVYLADTWPETLNRILKAGAPCSNSDFDWIYARWQRHIQENPPIPMPPPPPRFHETIWQEISPSSTSGPLPVSTQAFDLGGFERSGKQELPQTLEALKAYTYGISDWLRLMELHIDNVLILTYLIQNYSSFWRQCYRRILKWKLTPEIESFLGAQAPSKSRKSVRNKAKARRHHRK